MVKAEWNGGRSGSTRESYPTQTIISFLVSWGKKIHSKSVVSILPLFRILSISITLLTVILGELRVCDVDVEPRREFVASVVW